MLGIEPQVVGEATALTVNPPLPHDRREHSRLVSFLLLFPMVVVGGASIAGIAVSNAASTALQRADAIDVQLANIREHVRDAAVTGTAFLVSHLAADASALTSAGRAVDAEIATLRSSGDLNSSEAAGLDVVLRAWRATKAPRLTVLADGATNASAVQVLLRPVHEQEMNASLTEVLSQLTTLEDLTAAQLAARQHDRDTTQAIALIAIAVAITIGFIAGVWLLRQLKERQETVRRRERRLSALVEHANDGILVIDGRGQVTFVTPSFSAEFFGASDATTFDGKLHADDRDRATKAWRRVVAGGAGTVSEIEARILRRDGEWRHVWAKLTNYVEDPAVAGVIFNVTDVSDRREYERKLTHQALHDALTGLPNRDLLRHRLDRVATSDSRSIHSVLYLDCDDFKRVNDTLGHAAGDQYLVEFANRLVGCLRPEDTVARMGGDEFAVMLEHTDADGALVAAQRVMGAIVVPFRIGGKDVHPSASIGVASGLLSPLHPDTLVADADLAMYFAKRAGKGGYRVFVVSMRTELVDHLQLGEELRSAVESIALGVVYQPMIDLKTGEIVGAEALARWRHPTRGWVEPDTFIPLAEELGMVEKIDMWVLRTACAHGRAWIRDGSELFRLAVNLSGRDLQQSTLVENVARILRESGFPPDRLELELTEGVAIDESQDAQHSLEQLKSLGIHLAIDDFGTGYSALSRLRNLPFDRLKIDKAFVDDIGSTHEGPLLIDTILDMARVLGLQVVAEGVETPAQAAYLRERNCDFAQGFLFNRPMNSLDLGRLITAQHPLVSAQAGADA